MTKLTLVELSSAAHKDLKIKNSADIDNLKKQHLMNLRATELGHAATCYPVFATKNTHNGMWTFSAMTSFTPDNNLFVIDGKLEAIYRPTGTQTHPFYLMQSPKDKNAYTIGILEDHGDFSKTSGEAIFEEDGKKLSAAANRRIQMLEVDVQKDVQTAKFSKTLEELGLFKALDMNVQFLSGDSSKIRGLHTIDEDRLQSLSIEELDSLRTQGYLMPIHAMLVSILQVNKLIGLNNEVAQRPQIVEVKMEVAKEATIS